MLSRSRSAQAGVTDGSLVTLPVEVAGLYMSRAVVSDGCGSPTALHPFYDDVIKGP